MTTPMTTPMTSGRRRYGPRKDSDITVLDLFCGAGGSSEGASRLPGVRIRAAANHEPICIRTHNTNFPQTDHYLTDISMSDPRRFPTTRLLVASPECTFQTSARGLSRQHEGQYDLFGDDHLDPVAERSRVTMFDPLRFADVHDYDGFVIENVIEIATRWRLFSTWIQMWHDLGYETRTVYLNSMFAHPPVRADGTYSAAAPQSRDRIYIVGWKKGNPTPDLERRLRPWAWCGSCGENVQAVQSWKPGRVKGWYGDNRQYVYRCPRCASKILPYYYAAACAINWSDLGTKIGERKKPLAEKTIQRILHGLRKYGGAPFTAPAYTSRGGWYYTRPVTGTFGTITRSDHHELVTPPPFVMTTTHAGGTDNRAVPVDRAMPTQTSRAEQALVAPPYIIEPNSRNMDARAVDRAVFPTQTTGLNHALVVPNGGTWAQGARPITAVYPTQTARESFGLLTYLRNNTQPTPTDGPTATVEAGGNHHGLVTHASGLPRPFVITYRNRDVTGPDDPIPTVTGIERHGLATPGAAEAPIEIALEECRFRMLRPPEIKAAMAFRGDYTILGTAREQIMQCGQAVCPPTMELLIGALVESLV